jgi:hypothetical protein
MGVKASDGKKLALLLLTAGGLGILVSAVGLLLIAAAITNGFMPWSERLAVYGMPFSMIGGAVGGLYCVKRLPAWRTGTSIRPVLAGLVGGLTFWALLLVLGGLIYLKMWPAGGTLQSLLASLIGGAASPFLAMKRKKRGAGGPRRR